MSSIECYHYLVAFNVCGSYAHFRFFIPHTNFIEQKCESAPLVLQGTSICMMTIHCPQARWQGGGGSRGSLEPPFWSPKDFIYTALTVHFKCPTVGKWSTTGTSSLAAVENHRCPSKSGCSYQCLTRARKPFTALR